MSAGCGTSNLEEEQAEHTGKAPKDAFKALHLQIWLFISDFPSSQ